MAGLRRRVLPALVTVAIAAAGCGAGADDGSPGPGRSDGSRSEGTPSKGPDTAAIEKTLAAALPSDEAIGFPVIQEFEDSPQARGLTSRTLYHCTGVAEARSDADRVTRVERRWLSPAWGKGGGPEVQVRLDLVTYRDGARTAALDEMRAVPKTCPEANGEDGASRRHELYRENRGIFNERDVVAVLARLHYLDTGGRAYEASFAAEAGETSLAMLVIISKEFQDLKDTMERIRPAYITTIEQLDAAAGEAA